MTFGGSEVISVKTWEINGETEVQLTLDKAPTSGAKEILSDDGNAVVFCAENDSYVSYGISVANDEDHNGGPWTWSSRGSVIQKMKDIKIFDSLCYKDGERGWLMGASSTVDFIKKILEEFGLTNLSLYAVEYTYNSEIAYKVMTKEQAKIASLDTNLYSKIYLA